VHRRTLILLIWTSVPGPGWIPHSGEIRGRELKGKGKTGPCSSLHLNGVHLISDVNFKSYSIDVTEKSNAKLFL
jgi:hypothetical protein